MLRTFEQKIGFAVAIAVAYLGHKWRKEIFDRRAQIQAEEYSKTLEKVKSSGTTKSVDSEEDLKLQTIQKVPTSSKAVDHPLVPWLIENGYTFLSSLVILKWKIYLGRQKTFWGAFWSSVSVNFLGSFLSHWYSKITIEYIYSHIPFFSDNYSIPTNWELFKNFWTCNFPVVVIASLLEAGDAEKRPAFPKHFRPLVFMAKLAICRLITDLCFWIGHYLIHMRRLYFIHRRHHQYENVTFYTNYQFSWPDLLIEALLPLVVSVISLREMGLGSSDLEGIMLARYVFHLEYMSHAGKPIPTMSTFPPLSPLTRKWDDWNPWFHSTHHRLLKCNYSITPFWDWLFGTARW